MRHGVKALFVLAVMAVSESQGAEPVLAPAPDLAPVKKHKLEANKPQAKPAVPKWVTGISTLPDKICVVGTCGPAFMESDGNACAADDARSALTKSISMGEEGNVVMNESVIQEYWNDREGAVSQMKGTSYALACIRKDKLAWHGKN